MKVLRGVLLIVLSVTFASKGLAAAPPAVTALPARAASYEPINCDKSPPPAGAVMKLSPPAAPYALIFCNSTGENIAAVDGYIWFPVSRPGLPFLFHAGALQGDGGMASPYFSQEVSKVLTGDALAKVNAMLTAGYHIQEKFDNVIQLDVLSGNGLRYNIFFYIADSRPKYVLGCTDQCNTAVLLREYSLSEAQALMGK